MRDRFDSVYISSELERLGDQLETPLTVYLIGGGSMAFRDLKETTKDIDLVVTDGDALRQLQSALLACGYKVVRNPGEEYDELGAQRILENDDGVVAAHEPNSSCILKTIRKRGRGNIPSPKPNQRTKPSWSKATIRNNAHDLRILTGQLQGLKEVTYEGTKWKGRDGRDD